MKKIAVVLLGILIVVPLAVQAKNPGFRVKDVADFYGARENQLWGLGLVYGLNGTGDRTSVKFTPQMISNMLEHAGITQPADKIKSKNVAVVLVTAQYPPFAKAGSKIDITISSIGDASSLEGGMLLQTPLKGANNEVYAVGQGPVSIGGFLAGEQGPGGATIRKNHTTVGRVPGGAVIEQEVPFEISDGESVKVVLKKWDFNSASRLAKTINDEFPQSAYALDASMINIVLPGEYQGPGGVVDFIAKVGSLRFVPDVVAKVIINERTGTIISSGNARVSAAHITHGNLTIVIKSKLEVSQPKSFSDGVTTIIEDIFTDAGEEDGKSLDIKDGAYVGDIANMLLEDVKVTPRDIITIFQTLKEAGALQAELIII
jgi:flagellar P-ring protein FlgI